MFCTRFGHKQYLRGRHGGFGALIDVIGVGFQGARHHMRYYCNISMVGGYVEHGTYLATQQIFQACML